MTEHLPECCVGKDGCDKDPCLRCHSCCICEQLRACEQRVFKKAREAISWTQDIDDALDALTAIEALRGES